MVTHIQSFSPVYCTPVLIQRRIIICEWTLYHVSVLIMFQVALDQPIRVDHSVPFTGLVSIPGFPAKAFGFARTGSVTGFGHRVKSQEFPANASSRTVELYRTVCSCLAVSCYLLVCTRVRWRFRQLGYMLCYNTSFIRSKACTRPS